MEFILDWLLPCAYSFVACLGFCFLFNIHGPGMLICGGGGALGWLVYLLTALVSPSPFICNLSAAIAITLYSELMARVRRCPVTAYLVVALLPLVPGGGIYYAMLHCVAGNTQQFLSSLLSTFGIAGALALGALLGSSIFRLLFPIHYHTRSKNGG